TQSRPLIVPLSLLRSFPTRRSSDLTQPPDPVRTAVRRLSAAGQGYVRFAINQPGLFRTAYCPSPTGTTESAGDPHHPWTILSRRSEEHTSQLQSLTTLVCPLLLQPT